MKRNVATYLQFINEARTKEWMEVEDNLGKTSNMRIDDTTKIRVLEFIYESGEEGRRYTDIVKFIIEEIKQMGPYSRDQHRGYWSTNLTGAGGMFGGPITGLLPRYCKKNENGRWVLANDKLQAYFMKSDFRGMLDDDAMSALKDLLY